MNDPFSVKITESFNPRSKDIDTKTIPEILDIFLREDQQILPALQKEFPVIQRVIEQVVETFQHHGRLFYVGAGTSGRLGNLDAVECPPTFGTPPEMVQSILAGGEAALKSAIEGAEDNIQEGAKQANALITSNDIVIGIAASGTTPFVLSFLETSAKKQAKTVLITFNPISKPPYVHHCIAPQVGPEVIAGSTRLKAGTATKILLNWISSIAMIRLGKVYSHFMIDVHPSCEKLRKRTLKIFMNLTGLSASDAEIWLKKAEGRIKPAMVMFQKKCTLEQAKALLQKHHDHLRHALNE